MDNHHTHHQHPNPIVQQGFYIYQQPSMMNDQPTTNSNPLLDSFTSNVIHNSPTTCPIIQPLHTSTYSKSPFDHTFMPHHQSADMFNHPMDWISNSSNMLQTTDIGFDHISNTSAFPVTVPIPVPVSEITSPLSMSLNTPVTPALLNVSCHSNSLPSTMACPSPMLATFFEEDDTDTNSNTKSSIQAIVEKKRRRRESHNAVERRRRDNINERIAELGLLLPEYYVGSDPSIKPNKGQILRKVVDYVRHLQQTLKECLDHQIELLDTIRHFGGHTSPISQHHADLPQTIHALLTLPQHSITALTSLADQLATSTEPLSSSAVLQPPHPSSDSSGQLTHSMKSMFVSNAKPSPLSPMANFPLHQQHFVSQVGPTQHFSPVSVLSHPNETHSDMGPVQSFEGGAKPVQQHPFPFNNQSSTDVSLVPIQGHGRVSVLPPQHFISYN